MARAALFVALLFLPRPAGAFTIETPITPGCHEDITEDAWRAARSALPETTGRLPSLGDDQALIDDVPFSVPDDLDDIGVVTLLLGVRDNDVKGMAVTALDQLAGANAEPEYQKEHCLRTADQNEPGGSEAALDDCRAFIRATLLSALEGLDESGHPDGNKREPLEVTLAIRGKVRVRVPIFALRAGRGLHALEDSFTHTFRSVADPHKVTVVLNWIEYADSDLNEKVDGPPHLKELDRCDDADDLRTERHRLAVEAVTAALSGLLDPRGSYETKAMAVDAVLDQYVSFDKSQSCSEANHWCDAPELAYVPSGCGCSVIGSGRSATSIALVSLVLGAMIGRARKRWERRRWLTRLALLVTSFNAPRIASAEPSSESATSVGPVQGPAAALSGDSNAGAPGKKDKAGAFFARVAFGASYDKPGFSGGAGLRYQISKPYMLGFDAEWNPWLAFSPATLRPGALNTYFSVIRRFQLKSDSVNVRTTASLGLSFLLFDLVGAPSGSVGPFIGLSFLGVEWKVAPGFYLTIDPTYIALPVPHLTGVPFAYIQYRFLVGLEFGGG